MSSKTCPQCGTVNPADMSFCSNCGQNLTSPDNAPRASQEPPPTVFMGQTQSPPEKPFEKPAAPFSAPAAGAPPKKGGKGWIFAVAGCLGLLILSVIGLGVVAFVLGYGSFQSKNNDYPSPSTNVNSVSNTKTKNSSSANESLNDDSSSSDKSSGDFLVTILEARKKVGSFNQISAKSLVAKEYFPLANGAAQAAYTNGSKNVFLTIGIFDSLEVAKENFEDQIKGIKSGGGKVTYENTASDGTVSAIYNNKGFYFAEYCNTNAFCNRIHSDSQTALKSFFENYVK